MNHSIGIMTLVLVGFVAVPAAATVYEDDGRFVRVRTRISADSVTVGERFEVSHEFMYPDSMSFITPAEVDAGNCRILSSSWREGSERQQPKRTIDMRVMTLGLEEAVLPPLVVDLALPSGDTLRADTDEVRVPVRSVLSANAEPKPLKEQWEAPRDWSRWIAAAIVALAVLAAVVWWLRRRARRETLAPPPPQLPADYVALTELTRIEKLDLVAEGRLKEHYTLVTDCIRHYLEARYNVEAMDQTSSELLLELRERRITVTKLEELLQESDLVKFAKHTPPAADAEAILTTAREIVVKTAPRRVSPTGPDGQTEAGARAVGDGGGG